MYHPSFQEAHHWNVEKWWQLTFFLYPALCPFLLLRPVSGRSFLCWWFPSMSSLSTGLLPARTGPGPVLPLWWRSHDQVRGRHVFQGLWSQRWFFSFAAWLFSCFVLFHQATHIGFVFQQKKKLFFSEITKRHLQNNKKLIRFIWMLLICVAIFHVLRRQTKEYS